MTGKTKSATARLKQDYLRIVRDPIPYIVAHPLPSNILEWHYAIYGPEDTPYEGGFYHGKLVFPSQFPFKPPSIYIITPNGRFRCNTRLCLSISDFHPDTWNPAWSVSTILTGLLSFMVEKKPTLGSLETSLYEKKQFALRSGEFNLKNKIFCELFPDITEEIKKELDERKSALCEVPESDELSSHHMAGLRQDGDVGGPIANVLVIVCFAVFAYAVKYVLMSLA